MFRALGNALYKTPWWAMLLGGLFSLLLLALFTVPFNVIRLTDSGASRAENQAIQREIDHAVGDSALGLAERVVGALSERTKDPERKADLDLALKEIADARNEAFNAQREARRVASEATREAAREAKRAAREAAENARNAARDAAQQARDAAKEKIESLEQAKKELKELQTRVGHNDEAAIKSIETAIASARESEKEAEQAIQALKHSRNLSFGLGKRSQDDASDAKGDKSSAAERTKVSPPSAPAAPAAPAAPTSPSAKTPKSPPAPPGTEPNAINFDVGAGTKRVSGQISIGDGDVPSIEIKTDDGKTTVVSAAALTPELRDDIRRRVANDFRRAGIGSALILAFIPLFVMLAIAKVYIGRSRRAQEVAKQKTREAESANVNRQIVEAKLMALQAQVEPHFLYNTLANVQALTEVDPQAANQMTGHLIQYLRAALPKMRENISTIGQEVELVRAYLNILKMRMGDRLDFGIDVPESMLNLPFPPLMLPSLVENAIKHGLEPQREGGRIDVVAEKVGEGEAATIRLMVKDSGRGFTDEPVQAGGGVGLSNIRERLQALFGDRARLTLEANQPRGVVAVIETPASGASAFGGATAGAAVGAVSAAAPAPKSWHAKTLNVAARTHSAWANILMKVFVGIIALLGILFIVGLIGIATGLIPFTIGRTEITGIEGMALGTVVLLIAFGVLSIAALIVVGVLYGLGFLLVALAVGIPLLIMLSLFPALLPFLIVGFLFYWFWWRKRNKPVNIRPPRP